MRFEDERKELATGKGRALMVTMSGVVGVDLSRAGLEYSRDVKLPLRQSSLDLTADFRDPPFHFDRLRYPLYKKQSWQEVIIVSSHDRDVS